MFDRGDNSAALNDLKRRQQRSLECLIEETAALNV
jgi:hypothetical protein